MKNICSFCNNLLKNKFAENIRKIDKLYDVYVCETCMIGVTIPMPSQQDLSGFYLPGAYRLDIGNGIKVVPAQSISELPDKSFDVITLFHVFEHTISPQMTINECKRLLKEGGLLVIEVPNLSSLQASIGKKAWFHLDLPHHFYHFSEEGILALLKKNSFSILKVKQFSLEYNPFGWLQTLLNMSGIQENLFYSLLKSRELRKK